ncbi:MAG TPA: HAD family hydrolase [Mycobacteriales bacterium]|nr:HAD family hydrolase [Mycobacteriales bacterium]
MTGSAGVVFDVDGTLVDTNYLHVVAWWHAFRSAGHDIEMVRFHQTIGQGGERFVETILGHRDQAITDAHTDYYSPYLHQLVAFPAAADLLRAVKKRGLKVALATSASKKQAEHLTAALDADDVIDAVTTKDDAEESKPDPDIVQAALDRAGLDPQRSVFVGDTVWDVEAAGRAGLECICLRTGGVAEEQLRDAGAIAVYRDARHLLDGIDDSPIGRFTHA